MLKSNPYSRPSQRSQFDSVSLRELVPLSAPSHNGPLPQLPSPPRRPSFSRAGQGSWTLSTHIIPAAYPRTLPRIPTPPPCPITEDRAVRKTWVESTAEQVINVHNDLQSHHGNGTTAGGSAESLWCIVNRYVRADATGNGVTLFCAHANGFPKEIWEPTLSHLLSPEIGQGAHRLIDEVWSWEAVQHGDAALLNGDRLGGVFDWSDNARDVLQFFLRYLPAPTLSQGNYYDAVLPTHLLALPPSVVSDRMTNGFSREGRKIVAVGHSYGGCALALGAATYPALFSSLILVDPVIMRPQSYNLAQLNQFVRGALARRAQWSSRDEAKAQFRNTPFFARWDSSVLDVYLECGLTRDESSPDAPFGTEPVKLKMPPIQEAIVFAETRTAYEAWELVEGIPESVEIRWVVPGDGHDPGMGGLQATMERVWRRPAWSSHVVVSNAGHLIPQEAPKELATDVAQFIMRKYGRGVSSGKNEWRKANL